MLDWIFSLVLAVIVWCGVTRRVSLVLDLWFSLIGWRRVSDFYYLSQRSRAGIPSMRKPASRDRSSASVELCETEVCSLHIQLIGTHVWLSKIHKSPPVVDFWVFQVFCKIRILKEYCSALLCCVTHLTILPKFTCVMNVDVKTRQTFVTCFLTISCPHEQVCSRTTKYRAYQYEPDTDISQQFVSKQ